MFLNTYIYNVFIFNFKTNIMKKTKAFTMIEILIIVLVASIWMISVLSTANHAKLVNQRIMQTVIANQIATEWAEIMYQVRNTNFLKYENRKKNGVTWDNINRCRLALNYEECVGTPNNHIQILNTWFYYITNESWFNIITWCNDSWCEEKLDNRYAICLISWSWVPCTWGHEEWWDESIYWKFFRTIEWFWIYNMAASTTWWTRINIPQLSWSQAQEYRFCSRVYRVWWQHWEVEICSTMTNFIN